MINSNRDILDQRIQIFNFWEGEGVREREGGRQIYLKGLSRHTILFRRFKWNLQRFPSKYYGLCISFERIYIYGSDLRITGISQVLFQMLSVQIILEDPYSFNLNLSISEYVVVRILSLDISLLASELYSQDYTRLSQDIYFNR